MATRGHAAHFPWPFPVTSAHSVVELVSTETSIPSELKHCNRHTITSRLMILKLEL
jgi:hypothetical protein